MTEVPADQKTRAAPAAPSPSPWEDAYLRFETPDQEIRKFITRLRRLGADSWPRSASVVDLFCGRGNGMTALSRLGFENLEGLDLSPRLLAEYKGPGRTYCCDCRQIPLEDASRDIAIVQGGLHHLPELPRDLDQTLAEVRRILKPGGTFVAVEPWLTPFLRFVHSVCDIRLARRAYGRIDALATMIEHERETYEQWLHQPKAVLDLFHKHFDAPTCITGWGKLMFVGRPRK